MPEFNFAIIVSSFIAGLLTFFAPCTLPLVPAFLGIISGVGTGALNDPLKLQAARWQIFKNAVGYVLGFSMIFVLFGMAFSFLGTILSAKEWLERIGGILIILFGLVLLGWLDIPLLNTENRIRIPQLFHRASLVNSFLLGALFALGWTPCVGPLLGSILLLATTSGTVVQGTILLVVFSLGLSIPFLITALLIGRAVGAFAHWGNFITWMNRIAGLFLIAIGVLLATGEFRQFFGFLQSYLNQFLFFEIFINKFL